MLHAAPPDCQETMRANTGVAHYRGVNLSWLLLMRKHTQEWHSRGAHQVGAPCRWCGGPVGDPCRIIIQARTKHGVQKQIHGELLCGADCKLLCPQGTRAALHNGSENSSSNMCRLRPRWLPTLQVTNECTAHAKEPVSKPPSPSNLVHSDSRYKNVHRNILQQVPLWASAPRYRPACMPTRAVALLAALLATTNPDRCHIGNVTHGWDQGKPYAQCLHHFGCSTPQSNCTHRH